MIVTANIPPAQRILVMRYRFIGDTVLAVPFLRNLRYAYPSAVIDVLVGPESGAVLKDCPYINDLVTFNTTDFHKYDRADDQRSFFWYAEQLRQRQYDMIFVLKRSFSAAALAWLSRAHYRIGYNTQFRSMLLTHSFPWDKHIPEVKSTMQALTAVNIPIQDEYLEAWISDEEKAEVEKLAPEVKRRTTKILIHAAAAHPDKVYPLESWKQVMQQLYKKTGGTFFFTGDEQDIETYKYLLDSEVPCVNLAGKVSIRQSMALYSYMDLAVCVDSGPAHLAAAVGVPTVTLFGPTDPVRWRPWGPKSVAIFDKSLPCRPCNYHKVCDDRPCLTKMPADRVVSACIDRLHANPPADTQESTTSGTSSSISTAAIL
jgi:heptosyltransferase II